MQQPVRIVLSRCLWRLLNMSRSVHNRIRNKPISQRNGASLQKTVFEKEELAQIDVTRGVGAKLARRVAQQLMAKDALGAHARDEL